jgi:hypothetical protein
MAPVVRFRLLPPMTSFVSGLLVLGLVCLPAAPAAGTDCFGLDFGDHAGGPVGDWLARKGLALEKDAGRPDRIALSPARRGLRLEARSQVLGLVVRKGLDLPGCHVVEIEWGVERFPEGASWETGIRNEALSVMVFFGHRDIPSGNLFIPDTPYFLALFLGTDETVNRAYKARSYPNSGRWVCLETPQTGHMVTSRIDLAPLFREQFGVSEVPPISGVALSVDTSNSKGQGRAAAVIRGIRFVQGNQNVEHRTGKDARPTSNH